MPKGFHQDDYVPYPAKRRFYSSFFYGGEDCYTSEEVELRSLILNERKSKIAKEYLKTENTWFNEEFDTAFREVNENSWLYPKRMKPRSKLGDDFHFESINAHDKKWVTPEKLRKEIGDYLQTRNKNVARDYLNQPMNIFLLDLADILEKMAVDANEERVNENLGYLIKYIHAIARQLDPSVGSDLFFLADLQDVIADEFIPEINQFIESKKLKNALNKLHGEVKNYASEVNRILHLALTDKEVNTNTYLELLSDSEDSNSSMEKFPSAALSRCIKERDTSELALINDSPSEFDSKKLESIVTHCHDLNLIDGLPKDVKVAYAESVVKLKKLLQFSESLKDLIKLLDDTGEIMGVIQLNADIQEFLLKMIDIEKSLNGNIKTVLQGNRQKFRAAIEQVQSMSFYSRWMSKNTASLEQFIENQGILYEKSLTTVDLSQLVAKVEDRVMSVNRNLNDLSSQSAQHKLLSDANRFISETVGKMNQLAGKQKALSSIEEGGNKHPSVDSIKPINLKPQKKLEFEHLHSDFLFDDDDPHIQTSGATRLTPPLANWIKWVKELLVKPNSHDSLAIIKGGFHQPDGSYSLFCDSIHQPESKETMGVCYGNGYQLYVYPKQGSFEEIPFGGDHYSSCKPINFYGTDSLSCEGNYSTAIYQRNQIMPSEQFFALAPSSIMLYTVLAKIASDAYHAVFDKEKVVHEENFSQEQWDTLTSECMYLLARLHNMANKSSDKWVRFSTEDFQELFNQSMSRNESVKQLQDLRDDMAYFIMSYTLASEEDIEKTLFNSISQMSKFGLIVPLVLQIKECIRIINSGQAISHELRCNIDKELESLNLSSETIFNFLDSFDELKSLIQSNQKVFKSDLFDIEERMNSFVVEGEACHSCCELMDNYLLRNKKVGDRVKISSSQLVDYGIFASPSNLLKGISASKKSDIGAII